MRGCPLIDPLAQVAFRYGQMYSSKTRQRPEKPTWWARCWRRAAGSGRSGDTSVPQSVAGPPWQATPPPAPQTGSWSNSSLPGQTIPSITETRTTQSMHIYFIDFNFYLFIWKALAEVYWGSVHRTAKSIFSSVYILTELALCGKFIFKNVPEAICWPLFISLA